jgi:hypothetical protein
MKTIEKKDIVATLLSLYSDNWTGQGSTQTTMCLCNRELESTSPWLSRIPTSDGIELWGTDGLQMCTIYTHLNNLGRCKDIFECVLNSMWSITSPWSVLMALKNNALPMLRGQWKQTERNFRCDGRKCGLETR